MEFLKRFVLSDNSLRVVDVEKKLDEDRGQMGEGDKIVSEYLGYSDHFQVFQEQLL